jgi:hypothetical protein
VYLCDVSQNKHRLVSYTALINCDLIEAGPESLNILYEFRLHRIRAVSEDSGGFRGFITRNTKKLNDNAIHL